MDFLAVPEQGDDHGPIAMPRHDVEQQPRLGGIEQYLARLALADRVGFGPGPLRLVDDDHMRVGQMLRMLDVMIAKAGQCLDLRPRPPPFHGKRPPVVPGGVTRQGFAQDMNKGRIAGQERRHRVVPGSEHGVQAAQCLACPRDAGDEEHRMSAARPRRRDGLQDRVRRRAEVGGFGPGARQVGHAVARVQGACRIDDAGHRPVGRLGPGRRIDRARRFGQPRPEVAQQVRQRGGGGVEHGGGAADQQRPGDSAGAGPRGDQHRHDRHAAAGGVEILQVERVVLDLPAVLGGEAVVPDLEFEHHHGPWRDQHGIEPAAEAQERKFQHQFPAGGRLPARQGVAEAGEGGFPGPHLLRLVAAETQRVVAREAGDEIIGGLGEEAGDSHHGSLLH